MDSKKSFTDGMIAGALFIFAAQAGYWLITPMSHPAASDARWAAVVAQGVICASIALGLVLRQRKQQASTGAG
ncbi:MAG: hypothetical protein ACYC3L_16225 [Gemmatimonadaceae bacterium]